MIIQWCDHQYYTILTKWHGDPMMCPHLLIAMTRRGWFYRPFTLYTKTIRCSVRYSLYGTNHIAQYDELSFDLDSQYIYIYIRRPRPAARGMAPGKKMLSRLLLLLLLQVSYFRGEPYIYYIYICVCARISVLYIIHTYFPCTVARFNNYRSILNQWPQPSTRRLLDHSEDPKDGPRGTQRCRHGGNPGSQLWNPGIYPP